MPRIIFTITPAQVKALKAESARTGAAQAEIIRRAVDEYLQQEARTVGEPEGNASTPSQ